MSAINNGNLLQVKAVLALGADPNRAFPYLQNWGAFPNNRVLSITLPLALAMENFMPDDDGLIAKAILVSGADVSLCLHWLSVTESKPLRGIVDGLCLCEIIRTLPQVAHYTLPVEAWLDDASRKVNAHTKPPDAGERHYYVCVNRRLVDVGRTYGKNHSPVPWVWAALL